MSARDVHANGHGVVRLVRHQVSKQYFKGDGWTHKPEEAKRFSDIVEAAETCARHGLTNVELALRCHSEKADLFCTAIR